MKILRNKKALSPVVASIILIAVTVAVSIAVAAWMGALSFSFMSSGEQMQVGTPYGWVNGQTSVNITVSCPSGNAFTVTQVRVNNTAVPVAGYNSAGAATLGPVAPQSSITLVVTYSLGWKSGYSYQFVIVTARNNEYQTTGTVP
jgi:flagellin-like protein